MRALRILVAVSLLALFVGACSDDDDSGDGSSDEVTVELPAEVDELLANYEAAAEAADGEAMLDYVSEDFTFVSYAEPADRETYAAYVTENYAAFEVEAIGERTVLGGGDEYIVATPERTTAPQPVEGVSVIRVVQSEDGTWLIDVHRFTGELP
jgi:ketosteroid isomerase-like protein